MPPKFDPNEIKEVTLRIRGGDNIQAQSLAPKLGPLGLNPKKVAEDISKATKDFKGLAVMVKLRVQNRNAEVSVKPTTSTLVIKALGEPPRDRKEVKNVKHNGNLPLDAVIDVARSLRGRSNARTLSGTVREVLGTCVSVGCTVNNRPPSEIIKAIKDATIVIPDK